MAPTLDFTTFRAEDGSNTKRRIEARYTGPASYVTGGDSFLPADIKLGAIDVIHFGDALSAAYASYELAYDYTNEKVVWFANSTGTEVANATDLSALTSRFEAIGR